MYEYRIGSNIESKTLIVMNSVAYMQYLGLWHMKTHRTGNGKTFFSLQEAIIKKLPKQGLNKTQVTEKKQKNREGEGDVEKQACVAC